MYNLLLSSNNYANSQQAAAAGGVLGGLLAFFAGMTLFYLAIMLIPLVIVITIQVIFGSITAYIAGEKGYSKAGFFWYGFFFFPIAVGVAILAQPKRSVYKGPSEEEQIAEYRAMYEAGTMTWTEYSQKKEDIERQKYYK